MTLQDYQKLHVRGDAANDRQKPKISILVRGEPVEFVKAHASPGPPRCFVKAAASPSENVGPQALPACAERYMMKHNLGNQTPRIPHAADIEKPEANQNPPRQPLPSQSQTAGPPPKKPAFKPPPPEPPGKSELKPGFKPPPPEPPGKSELASSVFFEELETVMDPAIPKRAGFRALPCLNQSEKCRVDPHGVGCLRSD